LIPQQAQPTDDSEVGERRGVTDHHHR
jgi:hypothetical protein